jgi:hypothetical protein
MSLKSLQARLDKIPDPDLSRLRQQQIYEKLKPLPYAFREELRQQLKEHARPQAEHEDAGVAAEKPASTAPQNPGQRPRRRQSLPLSAEPSRPKSAANPGKVGR